MEINEKLNEKLKFLESKLKQTELERDIFYEKNDKLLRDLIKRSEEIKCINFSQKLIDDKILIKLKKSNERRKKLKLENAELRIKCNDCNEKILQQIKEINAKNEILLKTENLNEKYLKEINELKHENNGLLLYAQNAIMANKGIISKLEENHRIIRYLQSLTSKQRWSNSQYSEIKFCENNTKKGENKGVSMPRILFIVIFTFLISLSWNDQSTNSEIDMFFVVKKLSYQMYQRFMVSELLYLFERSFLVFFL